MHFEHSDKAKHWIERVEAFMDAHVYPNEDTYNRQMEEFGDNRWQIPQILEDVKVKAHEAGHDTAGTVAGSDAFFPFPDGVEALSEAGATAVVQPGGSVRDEEVIEACNRLGMAMVLTGRRHFRH